MSMRPSRNTRTSRSIAAYASGSDKTPNTTIATAPSRLAAGRLRCTNGRRWMAMRRYVSPKMMSPRVIRMRSAECGMRNGSSDFRDERWSLEIEPARQFRTPHSAFRIPHLSDLPIGEQHAARGMGLRVSFVGHPEVGPADAIAAGHEPTEGVVAAGLASHGDAPDTGPGRGGFGRPDRR